MNDYINQLPLLKWFQNAASSQANTAFPGAGNTDYWAIFLNVHKYLNNKVHTQVESGAAAAEHTSQIYLTRHDAEHIKVVMMRASELIARRQLGTRKQKYEPSLKPYEVFVLLIAIHIHDIANRTGRDEHEKKIIEEVKNIEALRVIDNFHLRDIIKIASCHGGKAGNDPDKIGSVLQPTAKSGSIEYRPQLLAAILKLADELADDRTRADLHGLKAPASFPKTSLLFHKYAAALFSVSLSAESHAVDLQFKFDRSDATSKFADVSNKEEPGKETYLLDYIYRRTLKTYRELFYCMRFMRQLDANYFHVKVSIEIFNDFDDQTKHDLDMGPLETIAYTIGDSGYPDERHGTLESLARGYDLSKTGEVIAAKLQELKQTLQGAR